MKKPFRTFGYLSYLAAAFFVLIGLWTFTFDKTSGSIVQQTNLTTRAVGAFPGVPYVSDSGHPAPQLFVTYSYTALGTSYISHNIGMGIRHWTLWPFGRMSWEQNASFGQPVDVYFYRNAPHISVLHRGFDVIAVLGFMLSGWGMVTFSKWIDSHA